MTAGVIMEEGTPFLPDNPTVNKDGKKIIPRILVFVSLLACAFSFTGVSMLYAIKEMTCDEYYKTHPVPDHGERCSVGEIEASSARAIASLGTVTTIFAVINLFWAGWTIKKYGYKAAMVQQAAWPVLRLLLQVIAILQGGYWGVVLMSASQAISGLGGPQGYLLVANVFASSLTSSSEETAVFGMLQGCMMFGTAAGFVVGGWTGTTFGSIRPFEVAIVITGLALLFSIFAVPSTGAPVVEVKEDAPKSGSALAPLKVFIPRTVVDEKGREKRYYGLLILGVGIFIGVLATGFNPILLQVYATNQFDFQPQQNGYMMAANSLIRGGFLSFVFPKLIAMGRARWAKSALKKPVSAHIPSHAEDFEIDPQGVAKEPTALVGRQPGSEFDLVYLCISMLSDTLFSGSIAFIGQGWEMYLVASLLPLAAGSAPASKGIITEMCHASQKVDALSAMAILETVGILSTTSLAGGLFSYLASLGKSNITFIIEAGVGIFAVMIMSMATFPPQTTEEEAMPGSIE